MNDATTDAMRQRIPVILAVTAASYGLALPAELMHRTASPQSTPAPPAPAKESAGPACQGQEPALAVFAMDRG